MRTGRLMWSAAVLSCLSLPAAFAQTEVKEQEKAEAAQKGGACKDDAAKFCKDVQPGGGRIVKCLQAHKGELAAPCREAQEKMAHVGKQIKAGLDKAKEACQGDLDKFCKDVQPGEGRFAACLKGHLDELAPACKIAYDKLDIQAQRRKLMQGFGEACQDELDKFCKEIPAGGGRKLVCLHEHESELSEACKAAMPKKRGAKDGKGEPGGKAR
ncbi:MAG: hypothetical protein HY922_08055 [Elusimicrobia bacterium]|nr:hypothetical protein [Elusimicrobiota bacterium]